MANWLMVLDGDEEQRSRYARDLASSISPFDGLDVDSVDGRGWSIVWSAGRSAPVAQHFGPTYGGMIWGEARDDGGALQSARDVCRAWRDGATAQWDGYYSAVVVNEQDRTVIAGTDLLGFWPLYYWSNDNGVVLIGTSPQLFRTHPAFHAEIDIDSLAGILLTNGLVGNRALWKGVRRLGAGNRACVRNGRLQEVVSYRVPTESETIDLPFRGHLKKLDASFRAAVGRHAPGGATYGLMLSGGLDSRLLAGYLSDQEADIHCLTFGKSRDFEMRGARAVASTLGFAHTAAEIPASDFADAASQLARWELLAAGFSGVPEWAMRGVLDDMPDRMVVGHSFDGIVGGIHIGWAYDADSVEMGLDVLLPTIFAWGLPPDELHRLFGIDQAHVVDAVMEQVRSIYDTLASREHHRAWLFDLEHRQRFHVGSALWPLSFTSWPVAPFLDRDVLNVLAALPSSSIADRRAQFGLLARYFPALAALPLDRNSWDDMPPRPALKDFIRRSLNYRVYAVQRSIRKLLGRGMPDRVYYDRLYNNDTAGWRNVRQIAEPHRAAIKTTLMSEEVDRILRAPGQDMHFGSTAKGGSAARLLMGLALSMHHSGFG
jgi:asparagine synthase (glutamine-hydrolysing)